VAKNWDEYLHLAKFSYNNYYQASLKMAPYAALYGRRCRTPLRWCEPGERVIFGPDLIKEAKEKVQLIQSNLRPPNLDRRAGPTKEVNSWSFRWASQSIFMYLLPRGYNGFVLKASTHPNILDLSSSPKGVVQ